MLQISSAFAINAQVLSMKNFTWQKPRLPFLLGAALVVIVFRSSNLVRIPAVLLIIVLVAFFGTTLVNAAGSTGKDESAGDCLLGAPIGKAKQTDLFTFFHLEETGSHKDTATADKVLVFKPSGAAFRSLVTVHVILSRDDRVAGLELLMLREFVDSPTNGVFARDIAKSLLRSALPSAERAAIGDLINEIEYRQSSNARPMIVGPGYKPPPLPTEPTAGYQTYLGQHPLYEQKLAASRRLRIENVEVEGAKALLISLR